MSPNTDLVNPEFAQNVALQLELLSDIDEFVDSTDEERKRTMDQVLQTHIHRFETGEITKEELEYVTNLWLDKYPLQNTVAQ